MLIIGIIVLDYTKKELIAKFNENIIPNISTKSQCITYSASSSFPSKLNKNTCPTNSYYNPSFLNVSNSYYYDFPVRQEIACYGSKIVLKCPKNQVIHILSAYYGIQSKTTTACSTTNTSLPECYRSETLTTLTNYCEKRATCNILLTSNNFGDPCIGFNNKQMLIQYQCLNTATYNKIKSCPKNKTQESICPALKNPSTQYEQKWCEPTTMSISCKLGQVINILCAFYGIDPNLKCPGGFYTGSPTKCFFTDFLKQINSICTGLQNCLIKGNPSFEIMSNFKNACFGYSNMLFVQWECVNKNSIMRMAKTSNNTHNLLSNCNSTISSYSLDGKCSIGSTYEPTFLTTSAATSFEYSIYEQQACQGGNVVLVCPQGLVIYIYAAYYGIQKNTLTSCNEHISEIPSKCYYPSTYINITSVCQNQKTCQLKATSSFFELLDPCMNYPKQLFIQYQCVSSYALSLIVNKCPKITEIPLICLTSKNSDILEKTWCSVDNSEITIVCANNQTIEILCAFYGLHPSITDCYLPKNSPICYFDSSFATIKYSCNGSQFCKINLASFPDPCNGMEKGLYVQWKCL